MTNHSENTPAATPVAGHRVARLEQIPSRNKNRLPSTGQWVCECGQTGRVRAPFGGQVDASLAAHRKHAAEAAAAEADSLMVEADDDSSRSCDECGAASGQPCEWSCTARPEVNDAPLNVRATVRRPDGDTFVIFAGQVPAWLWDDDHTRELWKRTNRGPTLANANIDAKARGYRVAFDAWDPQEAPIR